MKRKKRICLLLSICMVLALFPVNSAAAETGFSDMPESGHWSYDALQAAVENGLLQGNDGSLLPGENLTRAQLAAILNRAFGAAETADLSGLSDVDSAEWYYADIAKAIRMGTFEGSGGQMRPNDPVTRQEAFSVLARAIKLSDADTGVLAAYEDHDAVSAWAAPSFAAMVKAGYVKGNDGSLDPLAAVTREQFAQVMHSLFTGYINEPGTYTEAVSGNLMVNTKDVILQGMTVSGDLILGEGVGNGDVTLDNVTVTGRLVVRGGGENSIRIINKSDVGSIIVGKTGDGGVRIRTEEGCRVEIVYVDDGLDDVILEGSFNQVAIETDVPVVLNDATVTGLTVSSENADVTLQGATTVSVTQITQAASGTKLEVDAGAKIVKVDSAAESVNVTGKGQVTEAVISGSNTAVDTNGTKVTASESASGVTQNGKDVSPAATSTSSGGGGGGGNSSHTAAVTTLAELQSALADSGVTAITITAEIIIPTSAAIVFNKPVTIAAQNGANLEIRGSLTNQSTLTSNNRDLLDEAEDTGLVLVPDAVFINTGTLVNGSRFGMFKAEFSNSGTVTNTGWLHCGGMTFQNSGTINNTGDITLVNSGELGDTDAPEPSSFTNSTGASLTITGDGTLLLGSTCELVNGGTVASGGVMENYGTFTNTGTFTYTEYFVNAGIVNGVLTGSGENAQREDLLPAGTLAALTSALSSLGAEYEGIAITGDLTLDANLEIGKHVLITYFASLTVPTGTALTVSPGGVWTELKVNGQLSVEGGTLVTAATDDDDVYGQVTIVGGTLSASGTYTITNDGDIYFIRGAIEPDDMVIGGENDSIRRADEAVVTTEAELRSAMADAEMASIKINHDITLNSNLDVTKPLFLANQEDHTPYTLTIATGAAVTLRNNADFVVFGRLLNYGTFTNGNASGGMFVGSYGSVQNYGILHNENTLFVFEGIIENYESAEVGESGNLHLVGGFFDNKDEADFTNEGNLDLLSSDGEEGAIFERAAAFTNEGTFNNGAISLSSSDAFLGMTEGTFNNAGRFVNNGNVSLEDVSFTHTDGTFDTYNSGGLIIIGGSFSTEGAPAGSFNNEGYMKIIDVYGADATPDICEITLDDGTLDNDSNWLDYTAAVYSDAGLLAAETAQASMRGESEDEDNDYGFSFYTRMDIQYNLALSSDKTFDNFATFWLMEDRIWNDVTEEDEEVTYTLTVPSGSAMTIGQECGFHVYKGEILNNGTVEIAAASGEGDEHRNGGTLDIWPEGALTNNGSVEVGDGTECIARSEYDGSGDIETSADVTGNAIAGLQYLAIVHSTADFSAAVASTSPPYDRIEIKDDSNIQMQENLTVAADLFIEPGSGLIIPYGYTLILSGTNWMDNSGDISVLGTMTIGNGFTLNNNNNLEIGAISGSENALVTVSENAVLSNNGTVVVYLTGTLNAQAGTYEGTDPSGAGTYTPPSGD